MSCQSFCNNSKYRRICSYDNYHQDCKRPFQQHSFGCKSVGDKKMCVELNEAPGVHSYPTMAECRSKCNNLSPHSFECIKDGYGKEINYNCTLQNLPPNNDPTKGSIRYSNAEECGANCGPSHIKHSYACTTNGYGDKTSRVCILTDKPYQPNSDSYKTLEECHKKCGNNQPPLGQHGFKCDGKVCYLVKGSQSEAGWKYSNYHDCMEQCDPPHSGSPRFSYF